MSNQQTAKPYPKTRVTIRFSLVRVIGSILLLFGLILFIPFALRLFVILALIFGLIYFWVDAELILKRTFIIISLVSFSENQGERLATTGALKSIKTLRVAMSNQQTTKPYPKTTQTTKPYPKTRVIIGFSLVPVVGSILISFLEFLKKGIGFDILSLLGRLDELVFSLVRLDELVILGLYPLGLFGIPALIFGLIYARLELKRTLLSFIIISLVSCAGTSLYISLVDSLYPSPLLGDSGALTAHLRTAHLRLMEVLGLAMVSSWIVGRFALPKPEQLNQK